MNNDEIRLSILFQYYRAMFNGKGYGTREENPELKDIPNNIIQANELYLVDKNLINGQKAYFRVLNIENNDVVIDQGIVEWKS